MSRVVIKLGGSALTDATVRQALILQIAELTRDATDLIVVHGGGSQIASMLGRLQITSHFHDGLRITDRETRDVAQMVLAGKIGKDLVAELGREGVRSVSLAGGDGLSFLAERLTAEDGADLGYVGRIADIDSRLVDALTGVGMIPIIACLALGSSDWEYYNVNGDQMAAAVARGCRASQLVFVTDVGAVRDENGHDLASLDAERINALLDSGVASGGMRPKLRACLEALNSGVERISIVGGSVPQCLSRSVAGETLGTVISAEGKSELERQPVSEVASD
ncbi:MAG: acetylglutamate kinase [Acidobacteriota bacterium]